MSNNNGNASTSNAARSRSITNSNSEQGRWWSITCFDMSWRPSEAALVNGMSFIAGQEEVCPTTGRRHWQMVAHWKNKVRGGTVKRSFPDGAHISLSRSEAADSYVEKIETSESGTSFSFGQRVVRRNKKTDWRRQLELAKQGHFEDIDADVIIRYYSTLKKIHLDHMPPPVALPSVCGVWVVGPPGVGKSHLAREWYPGIFNKNLNKWWDGYKGEEQVLLDDVSPDHTRWLGWFLKIWADKYPFNAEVKGGSLYIRPSKLVVTSNYSIEELFAYDTVLAAAVGRRFYVIPVNERRF